MLPAPRPPIATSSGKPKTPAPVRRGHPQSPPAHRASVTRYALNPNHTNTMKTDHKSILAALATVAPSIAFRTEWTPDPDCRFDEHGMTAPGGCFHGEDPDDWRCWQSEVTATAIVGGEMLTGSAYLGGTWERYGDNPAESNPDISGYLLQMLEEALDELDGQTVDEPITAQAHAAQAHAAKRLLQRAMLARYDEQRRHLDAMADTALNA